MTPDKKHEAWLRFLRSVLDILIGRSKSDLYHFRMIAVDQHPALVPLIDEYIRLMEHSETDVRSKVVVRPKRSTNKQMHLFDLLREKTFFPQNLDLARFAERVLPNMRSYRYDKMSRSDIAARIVDYIESRGPGSRDILEESMRGALADMGGKSPKEVERSSFLSKWERIIKGDED